MKRHTLLAVGLFAFHLAAFSASATIVINFDTDAYGNPIAAPIGWINTVRLSELYAPLGVHFWGSDGPNGHNGGGIAPQEGNFGIDAHSGTNFLGFNRDPVAFFMDGGRPRDPEIISFDTLATHVSIFAAGGFNTKTFLMQGFDANGFLVASDIVSTQQWEELEIGSPLGIKSVQLSCLDVGEFGFFFVFDDLSVDFVPEPSTVSLLISAAVGALALRHGRKKP